MEKRDNLKRSINSIISLTEKEWSDLTDFTELRTLKKNELFLKEGQICDAIGFINFGALIYFKSLQNGNDVTTDFAFENEWVTNNQSRLNNSPSLINIKAMETTELVIIKNDHLNRLYNKIPKLEKLGRILLENAFVKITQLSIDLQLLSATERYLKLLKKYPEIFQRVPLYHIANYLGVAPKSLSRIRNDISGLE